MPNFKLTLEYEGTNYYGWQRQKDKQTVQEVLETCLSRIFKQEIKINGQGRIDAGAHALGQAANFKVEKDLLPESLQKALNSLLPDDIKIKQAEIVCPEFQARFSAKARHYRYLIYRGEEPSLWLRGFAYFYPYELDLTSMRKGAKYLLGRHDFTSFASSGGGTDNYLREVKSLTIEGKKLQSAPFESSSSGEFMIFEIKANAFLYHMVRNIVGTLLKVGRGEIAPLKVQEILEARDRKVAPPPVPAKGLYLVGVKY